MIDAGLLVTVNSDDPAYFGGYIDDNYRLIQRHLGIDDAQLLQLAGIRSEPPSSATRSGPGT